MVLHKFSDYKVYRCKDIEAKPDVLKSQVQVSISLRDPHTTLRDPHTTLRDSHEVDWKPSQGEGTGRADIRQTEFLALGKTQATIIQTY